MVDSGATDALDSADLLVAGAVRGQGDLRLEFVGGPGSGKSALSAHLVSVLLAGDRHPGLRATALSDLLPSWVVNARKSADAAAFSRAEPTVARRLAEIVSSSGQSSRRHAVTKTVNLLAELGRSAQPGPSVSEQGVLQAIGSIQAGADLPVTAELLDLCECWLPVLAVRVVVDRDEQIRRLARRSTGRSRSDGSAVSAEQLEQIETQLDELLLDWRATGPQRRLVTVENQRGATPSTVLAPLFHTAKTVKRARSTRHPI